MEQARARAGGSAGNKGDDAMRAAIEMANLYRALPRGAREQETRRLAGQRQQPGREQ